jgi:hypothetical protein
MHLPVICGFYAVQPIPEAPWHIKLGYSEKFAKRLMDYRCLCPQIRVIRIWECSGTIVERAAIEYVASQGFERIGFEVFKCAEPERIIACLDNYFFLQQMKDFHIARRIWSSKKNGIAAFIRGCMDTFSEEAIKLSEQVPDFTQYSGRYRRLSIKDQA